MPGTGGAPGNGTFYVSPNGAGGSCTSAAPCSITQVQTVVRSAATTMNGNLVVELADGTYRLTAPLIFTAADSGTNGHTITWQAATGAHPVLSGGRSVTGWVVVDSSKNIWKATAPGGFATRQLYVDGQIATRARSPSISRSDMTFTSTGWTFSKNVYANFGAYVTANAANNTGHITFTNNWGASASPGLSGPGNTVSGNIQISGDTFPADAQVIVSAAGLEAAYADLKTNP
jgi:hypothetical protein